MSKMKTVTVYDRADNDKLIAIGTFPEIQQKFFPNYSMCTLWRALRKGEAIAKRYVFEEIEEDDTMTGEEIMMTYWNDFNKELKPGEDRELARKYFLMGYRIKENEEK